MSYKKDLERIYLENVREDEIPDPQPLTSARPEYLPLYKKIFEMYRSTYKDNPFDPNAVPNNVFNSIIQLIEKNNPFPTSEDAGDVHQSAWGRLWKARWILDWEDEDENYMVKLNPKVPTDPSVEADNFGDML